jgi:hypothetical protein
MTESIAVGLADGDRVFVPRACWPVDSASLLRVCWEMHSGMTPSQEWRFPPAPVDVEAGKDAFAFRWALEYLLEPGEFSMPKREEMSKRIELTMDYWGLCAPDALKQLRGHHEACALALRLSNLARELAGDHLPILGRLLETAVTALEGATPAEKTILCPWSARELTGAVESGRYAAVVVFRVSGCNIDTSSTREVLPNENELTRDVVLLFNGRCRQYTDVLEGSIEALRTRLCCFGPDDMGMTKILEKDVMFEALDRALAVFGVRNMSDVDCLASKNGFAKLAIGQLPWKWDF